MKALSDFLAIILFFVIYKISNNIILATAIAVAIAVIQAAFTYVKYKKLEPMQWVSFALIVVFGGLTIALNDRTFIMLKTTILSWFIAFALLIGQIMGKNILKMLIGKEIKLPENVWQKLSLAWIGFFLVLGLLNLFIAYPFTAEREAVWVNFKVYAYIPLTIAFSIAQGVYIMRYLPKENT